MATDTQVEAQRLVTISLTKMAQSRTQRTGISLHKSLLVATVLQKARYLCMEEVFRMVQSSPVYQQHSANSNLTTSNEQQCYDFEDGDDHLIALTPEEVGIATDHQPESHTNVGFSELVAGVTDESFANNNNNNNINDNNNNNNNNNSSSSSSSSSSNDNILVRREDELNSDYDKENLAPEAPTYFDLDKAPRDQYFRERSSSITSSSASSYCKNLKRRRAVCDPETEEAVQSILPKKTRMLSFESDCDDSVFGDDDPFLGVGTGNCTDTSSAVLIASDDIIGSKSMDIERITSLVSIFSFGGMTPASSSINLADTSTTPSTNGGNSYGNLTRSSSTPDLCSAQAKENDSLQQRPFIAMTV